VDTSLFRTLVLLFGVCVLPQSPVIAYDVSSLEYTNNHWYAGISMFIIIIIIIIIINIYAYIRGLYVTGSSLRISS
jgi:hypothetical protein